MLNEFNTLSNWLQSAPVFSEKSPAVELLPTYQEWLSEHFNCSKSPTDETRSR